MKDLLILGPPQSILGYAGIATVIGLVLLLITIFVGKPGPLKERLRQLGWLVLVRDIGIGFLVAAIVSVTYESSTRSVSEKERGVDIIDKLMSTFLGEDVWREIRNEVTRTPVIRRNHIIKVALLREGRLPDGQVVSFPKCRALLSFESGYDLYRLTPENSPAVIQQALNYEMWNEQLQLSAFRVGKDIHFGQVPSTKGKEKV